MKVYSKLCELRKFLPHLQPKNGGFKSQSDQENNYNFCTTSLLLSLNSLVLELIDHHFIGQKILYKEMKKNIIRKQTKHKTA